MTTAVKFLNGLDTIGGNVVSFTADNTRLIMDLGMNFAPEKSAAELLAEGALPNLPTLFTDATSELTDVVFVSHLHLDHMGAFKHLTKPTHVYMSPASNQLYRSLQKLGVEAAEHVILHDILPEQPLAFGPFTVTAYLSDHDAPGAYMFLVNDGVHEFAYSGDVRLDGPHPERVTHWAEVLRQHDLELFMIEGTEFSFERDEQRVRATEMSLQTKFSEQLMTSQLVVINPYDRNIERLAALIETANQQNRQLIWDHRFATILRDMGMTQVLELDVDVDLATINAQPGAYVLQNHFDNLTVLDAISADFSYLHMNGEPLGDYDPRYQQLLDYLTDRGITMQVMGASGHAQPADLVALAQQVNAKVTVPWHSFKPVVEADALAAVGLSVYLPQKNEVLTFD